MTKIKTGFTPTRNGFHFFNYFIGFPVLITTKLPYADKCYHGLCGGMCFAAIDLFQQNQLPPSVSYLLPRESGLYQYLYYRQMDSYGKFGAVIFKFIWWTILNNCRVESLTLQEICKVKDLLSQGQPVVLGVVYTHIANSIAIWNNHQILVYSCASSTHKDIFNVYDPSFPDNDGVVVEIAQTAHGVEIVERDNKNQRQEKLRGFFVIPYASPAKRFSDICEE